MKFTTIAVLALAPLSGVQGRGAFYFLAPLPETGTVIVDIVSSDDASGERERDLAEEKVVVTYDLTGLDADCNNCTVAVYDTPDCSSSSIGDPAAYFYQSETSPWPYLIETNDQGEAQGSFTVRNGFNASAFLDKAVVVTNKDGSVRDCGVFEAVEDEDTSGAAIATMKWFWIPFMVSIGAAASVL